MREYLTLDGIAHVIGDEECDECFSPAYPQMCIEYKCDGLIHAQVLETDDELIYKCDVCGNDEAGDE